MTSCAGGTWNSRVTSGLRQPGDDGVRGEGRGRSSDERIIIYMYIYMNVSIAL